MSATWSVLVGNAGTVYSGPSETTAREDFDDFVAISKGATRSRANEESVVLMKDGVIVLEYEPENNDDPD